MTLSEFIKQYDRDRAVVLLEGKRKVAEGYRPQHEHLPTERHSDCGSKDLDEVVGVSGLVFPLFFQTTIL